MIDMKIDTGEAIGLFKFILNKMSWKLVAQLMVIGVFCGVSYFAWEARWNISSIAVSKWATPEINQDRLPALVEGLVNDVDPKAIMVWSANVGGDTRRPMLVWIDGVRRPELESGVEPLFPDSPARMAKIVQLIRGEALCDDWTLWSKISRPIKDTGVVWGCAVGIPPGMGTLVGVITVGFSERLPDDYTKIRSALIRWAEFAAGKDI
jgi:hypothetical protein